MYKCLIVSLAFLSAGCGFRDPCGGKFTISSRFNAEESIRIREAGATWNTAMNREYFQFEIGDSNKCNIRAVRTKLEAESVKFRDDYPGSADFAGFHAPDDELIFINPAGMPGKNPEVEYSSRYRGVVMHELGHALGLHDSHQKDRVMSSPNYTDRLSVTDKSECHDVGACL
jgi:hypothetical protein